MITALTAKQLALEWLAKEERDMNAFGSALPGHAEKTPTHLMILDAQTEEHDFGWVFYWTSREYHETGDIRHALGGNAPLIVDREDGSLHVTGTAKRTAVYVDEYRERKKRPNQSPEPTAFGRGSS
ncbi:MAG: YrhB domain-containing protein [Nibricoccus sp.]